MSGEIFNDGSMLEIFRAEVETHAENLTAGLLSLERDPLETQQISEMMRGAHSIKGAARIVGIDPAVRVAHVLEDGFVAAQNGQLSLRPEQIDVLLRGVDFLNRIAAASKEAHLDWTPFAEDASRLVIQITEALATPSDEQPSAVGLIKTGASAADDSKPPSHSQLATQTITIPVAAFLDATQAEKVRLDYVAARNASANRVVLDFSRTTDLDSTGLALLAALQAEPRNGGPRVEFANAGPDLQFVLKVTGIAHLTNAGGS